MSVAVDGVAGLSMRPGTVAWWRQATADLQTVRESQMIARHYAALWFSQQPVAKGLQAHSLRVPITSPPVRTTWSSWGR